MAVKYSPATGNRQPGFGVYRPICEESIPTFKGIGSIIRATMLKVGTEPNAEAPLARAVNLYAGKVRSLASLAMGRINVVELGVDLDSRLPQTANTRLELTAITLGVAETVYRGGRNYGSLGIVASSATGSAAELYYEQHEVNASLQAVSPVRVDNFEFPVIEFASAVSTSQEEHELRHDALLDKFQNVQMGGLSLCLDPTIVEIYTSSDEVR